MKIGEIFTEKNIDGLGLSLMDRLVIYEALTAYNQLLESGQARTKIRNCQGRIKDMKHILKYMRIEDFIRGERIDIEELLNWSDRDFKDGACLSINTECHGSDLPF